MSTIYFLLWGLVTLAAAYLVFRRMVRRDYQRFKRLRPLTTFMELLVVSLYFGYAWASIPPDWPMIHTSLIRQFIGLPLFVIGFGVGFSHMFWLGMGRAMGLQVDSLQQPGLYRYTRNPQLVSIGIGIIGYLLVWSVPYGWGWFILYWPTFHWMVLSEEEHLLDVFGQEYERYCMHVPRYFGFPSRQY